MDSDQEDETLRLLDKRQSITDELLRQPYDLITYLERASVHAELGYPDLAVGDSYRALLLCDESINEGFEYHEQALEALQQHSADLPTWLHPPAVQPRTSGNAQSGDRDDDLDRRIEALAIEGENDPTWNLMQIAQTASIRCYRNLAISLLLCRCLKSALEFCTRGLAVAPDDEELLQAQEYIVTIARRRLRVEEVDLADLPDQGLVRREVYPWNDHEPDRFSDETLAFLNAELAIIAPKCEVRASELPTLREAASDDDDDGSDQNISTNQQLGLFAKEDIFPGEMVLNEFCLLTANNRLQEPLCDACSNDLPPLGAEVLAIGCPDCGDILFCGEECLARAMEEYHPAVCDTDVDTIAKDPDPREKPFGLYLLLLARSLAMAETQQVHPLDLKEVKYIWGDFIPASENAVPCSPNAPPPPVWTLPFSFQYNVATPLHVLEKMDIDVFAELAKYDLWVFNTLYSKFRGTASARVNKANGHPEVAAVHPLWCLANHDCDPNVQWEWGGRMKLWCREHRVGGRTGGIRAGEEILNHYCDIDLNVRDRRRWALGSLGGCCMCRRCREESAEEGTTRTTNGI